MSFRDHFARCTSDTWVTKDHCRLKVSDMDTSHIERVVGICREWARNLLVKNRETARYWTRHSSRWEYWRDHLEAIETTSTDDYCRKYVPPFAAMLAELELRKPKKATVEGFPKVKFQTKTVTTTIVATHEVSSQAELDLVQGNIEFALRILNQKGEAEAQFKVATTKKVRRPKLKLVG